jgi:hypothetical protein
MIKILVIGDSHSDPEVPNDRYQWLGKMIVDERPDVVVDIGDFATMGSLSGYDKGTAKAENKRVIKDIDHAKEARVLLTTPIRNEQQRQRELKKAIWKPRLVALGGNHENRIVRYMNSNAELMGMYSEDVSDASKLGWEFSPFGQEVKIEGVAFNHYFTKPAASKGYSGVNATRQMLIDHQHSLVQGHTHRLQYVHNCTPFGVHTMSLMCGCYFDHKEDYAGNDNNSWWRGICILENVNNGYFDLRTVSYRTIKEMYSDSI